LLLVAIAGLSIGLYVQRLRLTRLEEAILVYRHPRTEGIFDALDLAIPLTYADRAPLDDVLKEIKSRTTTHPRLVKIPGGIPIYVDPVGLQEAERSLMTPVRRPPRAEALDLGEHLRQVLKPLGLGYTVKDGFLMITSSESMDVPTGEEADPYYQYRDVLR
jgi:hypothetical protein